MHYLIVDLNITLDGHKMGFVKETYHYLASRPMEEHQYHFLINEPGDLSNQSNIQIHKTDTTYQSVFDKKKGLARYNKQWEYIKLKANQLGADRIVLMEFDLYQYAIGRDKDTGTEITGILFRPFYRQEFVGSGARERLSFVLKKNQKKLILKYAVKNKSLKKVFVLNDKHTVNALNEKLRPVFSYLPDPVFDIPCSVKPDIREKYQIENARKIVLIFGYLDDRKNIPNILKAAASLTPELRNRLCFLIIGKSAENYKPILHESLIKYKQELQLIHKDEFVDDCEMDALFEQCDLVLRMNVNYFASSGIIGMAAKYHKPSLVSDYGIVADLTSQYQLGKLADPMDRKQITEALENFLREPAAWSIDGMPYYQDHSTAAFVETLLS